VSTESEGFAPEPGPGLFPELPREAPRTEPGWTITRSQLINALARITAGVPLSGPDAGKVNAESMADAILALVGAPAEPGAGDGKGGAAEGLSEAHSATTCDCPPGRYCDTCREDA
jgi:hypothetical protein